MSILPNDSSASADLCVSSSKPATCCKCCICSKLFVCCKLSLPNHSLVLARSPSCSGAPCRELQYSRPGRAGQGRTSMALKAPDDILKGTALTACSLWKLPLLLCTQGLDSSAQSGAGYEGCLCWEAIRRRLTVSCCTCCAVKHP